MAQRQELSRGLARRLRRELALLGYEKPATWKVLDNGSMAARVALHLLPRLYPRAEIMRVEAADDTSVLIPVCREELNTQFLHSFLIDEQEPGLYTNPFIFSTIAYDELAEYARINNLTSIPLRLPEEMRDAQRLIAELQSAQEQTGPSLSKSYWYLRKELGKAREKDKK